MDTIAAQFNQAILEDLTEETIALMDKALVTYNMIERKLKELSLKHARAKRAGRLTAVASLEMQMETVSGVLCMYREYVERQMVKLRKLHGQL